MDHSSLQDIQELIHTHSRRLSFLKQQKAQKGYNTEPEVLMEIEDIENTIQKLETAQTEIVQKKEQLQDLENKRMTQRSTLNPELRSAIRGLEKKMQEYQSIIEAMKTHTQRLHDPSIQTNNQSEYEALKNQLKKLETAMKTKPGSTDWTKIAAIATIIGVVIAGLPLFASADFRAWIFSMPSSKPVDLVIRVFNNQTNEPVPQIQVQFFPQDNPNFQIKTTDNSGAVRFAEVIDKPAKRVRISVTDARFERFDQITTLKPSDPFYDVLLSPHSDPGLEPTVEPTDPPEPATREPTTEPTTEPATRELTTEPTTEPTTESTIEPTDEPPPPPPIPTGKLAIPLGGAKIIIAEVNGTFIKQIDGARQPDYWQFAEDDSQQQLVVNGVNPPFDKLQVSDGRGSTFQEIGNPGLIGHSHPVWSVDGTRILYDDNSLGCGAWCAYWRDSTKRNDTGNGQIFVASGNRPIVGANPLYPQWTTGDRIVFRSCASWAGSGGNCGLWVAEPFGEPTKLTNNANHIPTDVYGDTAVFVSNEVGGDDWNVYAVNLLNSAVRQLTSHTSADGLAAISPDGRWVAFVSQRDSSLAIWYLALDGSTRPQKLFDIPPSWGELSPDAWYEEKLSWGK